MLRRLKELSIIPGVSGDEGRVRKYIKEAVAPLGAEVKTDGVGNLYVHKPGKGKRIMACAHMDEVGLIVRGILDNGLLAYDQCGIDPRVVVSKRVFVGHDDVPGVIGAKAIHLQTKAEFERALKHSELFIDIGAKDKSDAEKLVHPGDYVSFSTEFSEFGDGLVKGKALDDRVGCAMLIELLKDDYDCDFYAVFTVQEELGLRGAQVVAHNVRPELALILEGTTANDVPDTLSHECVTEVGKGAAITFMDGRTITREPMFKALKHTAEEAGIPYQLRRGTSGGTDAGAIHKAITGVITGGISVPCRYIHSPASVASISDFNACYDLAHAFLKNRVFTEVLENV